MPSYTRSVLKSAINGRIKNKQGMMPSYNTTLNNAVKEVCLDLDLRSTKRKSVLAPKLFTDIYDYTCPSDMKARKIIDIQPQKPSRATSFIWNLTTEEEFDRWKGSYNSQYTINGKRAFTSDHPTGNIGINLVAFSDDDLVRKLKLSTVVEDNTVAIGNLDTLTGDGGTWALFGDGTNLTADTDNYIKGGGSINWDISSAGGTTAGIQNTSLSSHDISGHLANGSAFCWVYITSATNITNFILRLGSDSSNYHSWTVTTNNEGTTFYTGWNLLRWDLTSPTDTGTPVNTAIDYAVIYMTKTAGKVSETDYRFDWLVVKKGDYYNLVYYSKYMWQNTSGTYLEDSTSDQDYLNVDTEEYPLLVEKLTEHAGWEVGEEGVAEKAAQKYEKLKEQHLRYSKSEAKGLHNRYYNI